MQISAGIFHYPRIQANRTRVINQRYSPRRRKINELLRTFVRPSKLHGHRVYHAVISVAVALEHDEEREKESRAVQKLD